MTTISPCGCRHEQLLKLIKDSTDVIYETDSNGHFTYINGAVQATLGYDPEGLIGRHFTELMMDGAKEMTVRHYNEQFTARNPSSYLEFPILTASGKIVWFGQSVQAVIENDRVTGFRAIGRDISERKRAERERQVIEERFQTFMNNIPAVAFVKDSQGRFIHVNQMMKRLFGRPGQTLTGSSEAEILPLDTERGLAQDQEVLTTGKAIQIIENLADADGQMRHWLVCKFPIPSSNGMTYIGCVSLDVTERLSLEEELAAARDAALASARQKSEFLANMSHEIRTPMNAVLGLLGLLLDSRLSTDQRELAETARSSAESLLTIINDILDFSKIEAGKLTFEVLEFDVRRTVESVMDLMTDVARRKSLDMGCVIDPDVPSVVRGDPARLRQVLLNLIGNALKFTERGGVLLQIDRDPDSVESADGVVLRCRITDSGIGMSKEEQQQIFQPFMQADPSTTRVFGGTGLGLAISRQLVHMMEGEISVESEPDCGSSFCFTARFGRSEAAEIRSEPIGWAVPRVLVVDDSPTTRQIVSLQLTSLGISNDMADDSGTALAMLRREALAGNPYDVIISDLNMPRTNGVTLARLVKADPTLMRPRFILLTSTTPRFDAAALTELGVTACLIKPAKRQHLVGALLGGAPTIEPARPLPVTVTNVPVPVAAPTSRPRILVADDSAVNQKVTVRQLEKLGYAADAVGNGAEALDALERIAYQAVLMDCQMPQMDGFAATAELRRRENGTQRHTLVIALTASATARDRQRCLDAGMDDYIVKPTLEPVLAETLERALR